MNTAAAVAESHTAVVFLVGDRAYKVKKPLDLGFLDFTTREARRRDCHREVQLNSRLAPDVSSASPTSSPPTASCATTWW